MLLICAKNIDNINGDIQKVLLEVKVKKVIEYDSKMNKLSFGKFKEKELDLFFSICYKMKNEGLNEVTLTFQELKELSNYSSRNLKRFVEDLESTYTKLLDIKFEILISPKIREKFVLFTRYRIDEERKEMTIQLHKEYNFVLNDIGKFTKFDLIEFASLKSAYAKNMFRLLKQFDTVNKESWYQVKLDDFIELMGIPEYYKMGNIDQRVLSPILEQLKPLFQGLKIEKLKRGVKVESLRFTWRNKKEKKEKILDIQAIKKKSSIGEKELEEHQRQTEELKKEILVDPIVELKKISKKDYEELYDEHLKQLGEQHNPYIRRAFDFTNKSKYEVIEDIKEEYIQTRIYTTEDIDESRLVSKTGKKLVGNAKKFKIEKLLKEMNLQNNIDKEEK